MPSTRNERASAINVALPWRGLLPTPDSIFNTQDRAQLGNMYCAIAQFIAVTSTEILQKPVNCVLAGQQREFKQTRLSGRAMSHAFGE